MYVPIFHHQLIARQRGGALLVMLVILVIGITTAFVTSLSSTAMNNKRNQNTAEALAQAKEALLGSAVTDETLPGSLPCPDLSANSPNIANDGVADMLSGNNCPSYLGRLPWKTIKFSDVRDGSGERLWYALSPNFRPQTSTPHTLNSDTPGTLIVSGNVSASDVIAIIFAPGRPLSAQGRSAANENNYAHYLESVVTSPSSFQKSTPNDHADGSFTYNDQMVFITYGDLMPLVEKRIAREVKSCLDEYALSNPKGNYPWPAKISNNDYTSYWNSSYILFGRIPTRPNVFTTSPNAQTFIDMVNTLQVALNNYAASNTAATRSALDTAGDALDDYADIVGGPVSGGTADKGETAGKLAEKLARTPPESTVANVQSKIDIAIDGLRGDGLISNASVAPNSMLTYWPNCPILTNPAGYWENSWKSLLFFQVADNCRTFFGDCNASGGDLAVSGSGNLNGGSGTYRAAVVLSRKMLPGKSRPSTTTSDYLESTNVQNETDTTPNTFLTYKMTDSDFSTVNDLVMCLDGGASCR